MAGVPDFQLPFGVVLGQVRPRTDRPVKNGRWYLVQPGLLAKIGWGDLSFADMERIAGVTTPEHILVIVPEHPPGGLYLRTAAGEQRRNAETWCWYDRPDDPPGPTAAALAANAWYAILDGEVRLVDHFRLANRLGAVWRPRGYRYARSGRQISTGKVRLRAITPAALLERLDVALADRYPDSPPDAG